MSGIIQIEALSGPRFAAALELLGEGGGFSFEGVVFRFAAPGVLRCIVESSWRPERVSMATATADFNFAIEVLQRVRAGSQEFAALTQDVTCRFELIDDYGGGAVLLATREGDRLTM